MQYSDKTVKIKHNHLKHAEFVGNAVEFLVKTVEHVSHL